MAGLETIRVEVVFGMPEHQELVTVEIAAHATCADAIARSGVEASFPDIDLASLPIAVWGRQAIATDEVRDGDRVEILRPLAIDPREARRRLALAGKYMGTAAPENGGDS